MQSKFLQAGFFARPQVVWLALEAVKTGKQKMANADSIPQPKHVFTMAEYQAFVKRYWEWLHRPHNDFREEWISFYDEYLNQLPVYIVARCPFCGGRAWDKVDTYSLNGPGWWMLESPDARFHWSDTLDKMESDCGHAQLMSWSINLNDRIPDDVFVGTAKRPFEISSERPRLMLWPMQVTATRTCAVIHALPIGRFDDAQPQHRYTAFFVTYFAEDATVFREAAERGDMSIFAFQGIAYDFDLIKWVKAKRLFWLKPSDPSLPLQHSLVEAFPYGNVQGLGLEERIKIIDGQVKRIRFVYQ